MRNQPRHQRLQLLNGLGETPMKKLITLVVLALSLSAVVEVPAALSADGPKKDCSSANC
jgi:hypothetical protein